jgi:hypothetical protein
MMARKEDYFLPVSTKPQSKLRVRALLGHCLYRRVVIWALVVVVLLSITLFNPQLSHNTRNVLDLVQIGKADVPQGKVPTRLDETVAQLVKQSGQDSDEGSQKQIKEDAKDEKSSKQSTEETSNDKSEEKANESKESKQPKKQKQKQKSKGPHWLDYKQ